MDDRKEQELNTQDRSHLDRRCQEDMAWLEMSGGVLSRENPPSEGWMASYERNPMLWTVAALAMGALCSSL